MKVIVPIKWRCNSIKAAIWISKSIISYCSFFHTTYFLFLKLSVYTCTGSTAYIKWSLHMYMIISLEQHSFRVIMICLLDLFGYRVCQLNGAYNEGDFDFKSAWSYLTIINNISQIVSHPKHTSAIVSYLSLGQWKLMWSCTDHAGGTFTVNSLFYASS